MSTNKYIITNTCCYFVSDAHLGSQEASGARASLGQIFTRPEVGLLRFVYTRPAQKESHGRVDDVSQQLAQ